MKVSERVKLLCYLYIGVTRYRTLIYIFLIPHISQIESFWSLSYVQVVQLHLNEDELEDDERFIIDDWIESKIFLFEPPDGIKVSWLW